MSLSEVIEDQIFYNLKYFALIGVSSNPIKKIISGTFKELKQIIRENIRVLLHFKEEAGKSVIEKSLEYHVKGDGWCGYRVFYRIYLAGI